MSGVRNSGGWGVLNVLGCSKSVSGLSMGVLNLTLKVSDERGENMPLSRLPTPLPSMLVKLRSGVSGRGIVLVARGLDDPGIAISVTERLGAIGEILRVVGIGLELVLESEVGLAVDEESAGGVVPRLGVTKLV